MRNRERRELTSSYMNWSVRADFPTPPLPTIITLWTTGWLGVFLEAIFFVELLFVCDETLLTVAVLTDSLTCDSDSGQCTAGSWLRQRSSHFHLAPSSAVPDAGWSSLEVDCFCDGQANVKILVWFWSSTSRLRWIACDRFDNEVRAVVGHCKIVWRMASHLSLTVVVVADAASTWPSILFENCTNTQNLPLILFYSTSLWLMCHTNPITKHLICDRYWNRGQQRGNSGGGNSNTPYQCNAERLTNSKSKLYCLLAAALPPSFFRLETHISYLFYCPCCRRLLLSELCAF